MAKYIDAEAVKSLIMNEWGYESLEEQLDAIPSADVVPVRHGHWKPKAVMVRSINARNYTCSCCGYEPIEAVSFCTQCGANMDEEDLR